MASRGATAPEPKPDEAGEIVFQRAGINWSLVVKCDPLKLRAAMDFDMTVPGVAPPPSAQIEEALQSASLTLVPDLSGRLTAACSSPPLDAPFTIRDLLVAEGIPPSKGKNADIKWFVEWERTKSVALVEDKADYHATGHIVQVKEGDPILEVIPPSTGSGGVDVFGGPIPGLLGDPLAFAFGDNVALDAKTNILRALISGEVRRDETKLWVDQVYRVEGDVDFNVGNIDFAGDVAIGGSVQDGFTVHAKGDIRVYGSVMAATLEAGKNIYVGEGVTGHEKGSITAGGLLQAKYLNGVTVKVGGDLKITNEVINCNTKIGGRAVIERGAVVGGTFVARRGVELKAIGTQITIPTVVRVGIDPDVDDRRQAVLTRMKEINRQIERIFLNIKPFVENPASVAALPPQRRELVKQFLVQMAELKAERDSHEKTLRDLEANPVDSKDLYVAVGKVIYGKTTIFIDRCSQNYPVEVYGPLTLIPDEANGRLKTK